MHTDCRYLFDCKFVGKAPGLAPDFAVPAVFEEDLFGVLGDARPDYRCAHVLARPVCTRTLA